MVHDCVDVDDQIHREDERSSDAHQEVECWRHQHQLQKHCAQKHGAHAEHERIMLLQVMFRLQRVHEETDDDERRKEDGLNDHFDVVERYDDANGERLHHRPYR